MGVPYKALSLFPPPSLSLSPSPSLLLFKTRWLSLNGGRGGGMADLLKKGIQSIASILPGRDNRRNETIGEISGPVDIHYGCDGCGKGIKEGEYRYNCDDCPESFDLCQSCYGNGDIVQEHLKTFGNLHTFTCETRNNGTTVREVTGEGRLEDMILKMFKCYADRPAVGSYIESRKQYEYISFKELEQFVTSFASSLHHVMSGDHTHIEQDHTPMVALCSLVRLEWYIADYACALIGIPSVGITASSDEETISCILNETESSVVVCSPEKLSVFIKLFNNGTTTGVKHIIIMNMKEEVEVTSPSVPPGVKLWRITGFIQKGKDNPVDITTFKTDPQQIFTIIYTSGSTGRPKGCVFPRSLWLKHILSPSSLGFMGIKRIWFSFQPPSHLMERESFHLTLMGGYKAGIYRGTMEHLFEDIRMVRPTVVTSTPRFYLIIYNKYLQTLLEEYQEYIKEEQEVPVSGTSSATCDSAPHLSSLDLSSVPYSVKDKVRDKFKDYFGGRERVIGVGGAAVPRPLLSFLSQCFNGLVQEGYGTTEVGGITGASYSLNGVNIKLRDVPEMGYFTTDTPPSGEICVKTLTMIPGYYKNDEVTNEKFQDGYFLTGDIGIMHSTGQVNIIDRKKSIFKLAQGEFVAPEKIENIFETSSCLIDQVYVYGNIWRESLVAVVVPHEGGLEKWWNDNMEEEVPSLCVMCGLHVIGELFLSEIRRIGEAQGLLSWEIPSSVLIEPEPFTQANRLLTPTLKKSRPQLEMKYKEELEALYEEPTINERNKVKMRPIEEEVMCCLVQFLKRKDIPLPSSDYVTRKANDVQSSTVTLSLTLTQLGGDSLSAMSLSNLLQEEVGVSVPAVHILKSSLFVLFQSVVTQLCPGEELPLGYPSLPCQTSYTSSIGGDDRIDWDKETDIHFLTVSSSVNKVIGGGRGVEERDNAIVLLTGSTGFLGRFILLELLDSVKCDRVYAICRGSDGEEKMMSILRELCTELNDELEGGDDGRERKGEQVEFDKLISKLIVIRGDLALPRLGLTDEVYTLLCNEVDTVIHNGANVNHILSYTDLRGTNVTSTKELLKLCSSSVKSKYLHYVSSLGIFPFSERVNETTLVDKERIDHLSGYTQSKWVSEQLVMKAISNGYIKGSLSRPGLIGAHSVTGHLNRYDWFCRLVCGLYHLKAYPVGPSWDGGATHVVTVDTVAKSVVALSLNSRSDSNGYVYHLNNASQSMVSLLDLIKCLEREGLDPLIKPLGEHKFLEKLENEVKIGLSKGKEVGRGRGDIKTEALVGLHLLLSKGSNLMPSYQPQIDNSITSSYLRGEHGIELNAKLEGYTQKYISYLRKRGMI